MSADHEDIRAFAEVVNKDDVFIAVMGLSGSGKSSLIGSCTKQDVVVGHNLSSCTTTVSIFSFDHTSRDGTKARVHLIDTPGFNDSDRSDVEILQEIVFWLTQAFDNGFFLDGIVYLHNIVSPRFSEASRRSLEILRALCGTQNCKCIYLASTFWDDAEEYGKDQLIRSHDHHNQLVSKYWQDLIAHGAHYRPPPTMDMEAGLPARYDWAVEMVDYFIDKSTKHVLQVQSEMRSPNANLRHTSAATVAGELWRLDEKNKKDLPLLNRTKGQLNSFWTRAAMDDVEKLTLEIDTLKQQLQQTQYQAANVYVNIQNHNGYEHSANLYQQNLEQQINRLEIAKQTKIATRGFWVNVASAAFGGISAVTGTVSATLAIAAPLGLLAACTVM